VTEAHAKRGTAGTAKRAAAGTATGWDCHVHVFDATAPSLAGHYAPADAPLASIETLASAQGVGHLVLVQPSVYGTDNSVMLRALGITPGRHRGVAVIDSDLSNAQMDAMHALGVRGVRLNLVSPLGESANEAHVRFHALAPKLRRLGWHVQWYARAEQCALIDALHQGSGVRCVLDHLAGFTADTSADHPAWRAVAQLANQGAWLKLSGWYRLGAAEPYADLVPHTQRLAALFGQRLVWGSDWPHTSFAPDARPAYPSTWMPVVVALGALADTVRRQGALLYA
jgi:predicted TIM-barrel fold metal-dependent hydrolase